MAHAAGPIGSRQMPQEMGPEAFEFVGRRCLFRLVSSRGLRPFRPRFCSVDVRGRGREVGFPRASRPDDGLRHWAGRPWAPTVEHEKGEKHEFLWGPPNLDGGHHIRATRPGIAAAGRPSDHQSALRPGTDANYAGRTVLPSNCLRCWEFKPDLEDHRACAGARARVLRPCMRVTSVVCVLLGHWCCRTAAHASTRSKLSP
ncbi:uncharacterized protein FIBRA_07552 [Fibroporia radiculosa]|uniref:Uncharacterized protein n=1 Tax=Fibroporia radiculosa TaxID=599839 RepID=J4GEV4_9APHY|nr:uncharacterized protein FIBRA_07552 [Fibroporia radiculosa]CCM05338.1 predicted protein [Fibroporia radiculosa]